MMFTKSAIPSNRDELYDILPQDEISRDEVSDSDSDDDQSSSDDDED
jgi:hypothetical protein